MRRSWSRAAGSPAAVALAIFALLVLSGRPVAAQTTSQLTIAGSVVLTTPVTFTEYDQGYVCSGTALTYTVSVPSTSANKGTNRTDVVYIRAAGPITGTPSGNVSGTKLSDFQWTTNAAGCATPAASWASLTTTNAQVATGTIKNNGTITGSVWIRLKLAWGSDIGGTSLTIPQQVFSLNQ